MYTERITKELDGEKKSHITHKVMHARTVFDHVVMHLITLVCLFIYTILPKTFTQRYFSLTEKKASSLDWD